MTEENKMSEVISEIKNASEDEIKKVVEEWFERTRTDGLKIGAGYISAAIYSVIQKHIIKKEKASLRDYKRMTDEIIKIISVQLIRQNDSEEINSNESVEEIANDE